MFKCFISDWGNGLRHAQWKTRQTGLRQNKRAERKISVLSSHLYPDQPRHQLWGQHCHWLEIVYHKKGVCLKNTKFKIYEICNCVIVKTFAQLHCVFDLKLVKLSSATLCSVNLPWKGASILKTYKLTVWLHLNLSSRTEPLLCAVQAKAYVEFSFPCFRYVHGLTTSTPRGC